MEENTTLIIAKEGYTFIRIHDGFDIGSEIYLGIDYSTGESRKDLPEYYKEEIKKVTEEYLLTQLVNINTII